MSFIQRELDKINIAINQNDINSEIYKQLHAAQQALSWALDPTLVRSPYNTLLNVDDPTNGLVNATLFPDVRDPK